LKQIQNIYGEKVEDLFNKGKGGQFLGENTSREVEKTMNFDPKIQ
jgi:hypothetical protein